MRRPALVKLFLVVSTLHRTADQREAHLTFNLSFLGRFFSSAIEGPDRRPTGGAQCVHPQFSNHRIALLPSALFCGAIAPVPAGCPQLETGAAISDPN